MGQGLSEPGRLLGLVPRPELVVGLVGLQQRLLDDPRQVNLALQAGVELQAGQQRQEFPEPLQLAFPIGGPAVHPTYPIEA